MSTVSVIEQVTYTRTEDKPKNWHSRRQQSCIPHDLARRDYAVIHSRQARKMRADDRDLMRAGRSPQQQLALLDQRLGIGVGAKRERSRLQKLIS